MSGACGKKRTGETAYFFVANGSVSGVMNTRVVTVNGSTGFPDANVASIMNARNPVAGASTVAEYTSPVESEATTSLDVHVRPV
jgi:hypothetical protein